MNTTGLVLAIGAALAFAGFDVTRKQVTEHLEPLALSAWLALGSLPFLSGWCLVAGWAWTPAWLGPGLASVLVQGLATVVFLTALRIAPLSRTVPFLALTPVLSAVVGWLGLGELPRPWSWVGMVLVTGGAFALALDRAPGQDGKLRVEKGSLLASLVALLWSASAVIDKRALDAANPPTHALLSTLGVFLLFTLERSLRGGLRSLALPRVAALRLLGAAVFGSAALGLQLSAFGYAQVSAVETVKRAVGGFAALVIGRIAFREVVHLRAVLAVGVMTVGTGLVLLGP